MESGVDSEDRTTIWDSNTASDDYTLPDGEDASSDVEMLKRVWRNEKAAPDILPFQTRLIERVQEQISLMVDNVAAFAETFDELMLSIFSMDINRTLFLLRAYLRVRLAKIEKFAMHISRSNELWERLSEQERDYAQRYIDALSKHMGDCVLDKMEIAYNSMIKQATSSAEEDMIGEPPSDTFIFCRSKGAIGPFQLDDKVMKLWTWCSMSSIFSSTDL